MVKPEAARVLRWCLFVVCLLPALTALFWVLDEIVGALPGVATGGWKPAPDFGFEFVRMVFWGVAAFFAKPPRLIDADNRKLRSEIAKLERAKATAATREALAAEKVILEARLRELRGDPADE